MFFFLIGKVLNILSDFLVDMTFYTPLWVADTTQYVPSIKICIKPLKGQLLLVDRSITDGIYGKPVLFQIRTHTMSFREGLSDLINLEWLRMFDQHELQVLISGSSVPINIEDLKQHTNYSGGYTADHPVITMFWDIVERFSDEQRGQLLKFITSCSRPPLLGFKVK